MATDLSRFHQPISDFLSASDLGGDLDRYRLTREQLDHYDEFGYVAGVRLNPAGINQDELELDMIDHGLEEMGESTGEKGEAQLVLRCGFGDFGRLQEALEKRGIAPLSAEHEFICSAPTELPEAQAAEALTLIDALEQDDDVQHVFHTLA